MKIVSWNCNGGFRKKYDVLFGAFPDADLFGAEFFRDSYNRRDWLDEDDPADG